MCKSYVYLESESDVANVASESPGAVLRLGWILVRVGLARIVRLAKWLSFGRRDWLG